MTARASRTASMPPGGRRREQGTGRRRGMGTPRGEAASPDGAADFVPARGGVAALRRAAEGCRAASSSGTRRRRCSGPAPHTHGPSSSVNSRMTGRTGRANPSSAPAGRLLRKAPADPGINEEEVYFTNVVKHFKFAPVTEAGASWPTSVWPHASSPDPVPPGSRRAWGPAAARGSSALEPGRPLHMARARLEAPPRVSRGEPVHPSTPVARWDAPTGLDSGEPR